MLTAAEVTQAGLKEWSTLPPETQRVFRDMLKDDLIYDSAVTGEVRDKNAVLGAARKTKYEGQKWRPDVRHVQRAKALNRNPAAKLPVKEETEEQKQARFRRAATLLFVS